MSDDLRERALAAYNQVWNAAEGIDASTVGAVRAKAMDAAIVIIRTAAFNEARDMAAAIVRKHQADGPHCFIEISHGFWEHEAELVPAIEKMEPEG